MGKNLSKELKELIEHPESEADLRKVFASLDGDKDGSLSLEEWNAASELFWSAVRGGATDHVKAELKDEIQQKAPMMKNMMAKIGAHAVDLLSQQSEAGVEGKAAWTGRMFQLADKDQNGSLSFDEFVHFVQHEAREEQKAREAELRDQLAANMLSNHGKINVQEGNSSVMVDIAGLDVEKFQRKDRLHLHVPGREQKALEWSETQHKPRGYVVHSEKEQVRVVAVEVASSAPAHALTIDGVPVQAGEQRISQMMVRLTLPEPILIDAAPRKFAVSADTGQLLVTTGDYSKRGIGRDCFCFSRYGPNMDLEIAALIVMDLITE